MRGWIGVDLDGTLAHYTGWIGPDHIGEPIPEMLARVRKWLEEGKTVKIFTARCCVPEQVPTILAWLERHGIGGLEVTNVKDFGMVELWDDRCVRVVPNTGLPCCGPEGDKECTTTPDSAIPPPNPELGAMTHFWCENCGAIKPAFFEGATHTSTNGNFVGGDVVCAACSAIIVTAFIPKT